MSRTTQRTLRGDPRGRLFVPDPVARSKVARLTRSDSGSYLGSPSGAVESVYLSDPTARLRSAMGISAGQCGSVWIPLAFSKAEHCKYPIKERTCRFDLAHLS